MLTLVLALSGSSMLKAQNRSLDFAGRKADRVEEKRFDKKFWAKPGTSRLQNKSFPIEEWDKHFSSLGSKRAAISTSETKKKKLFKTEIIDRKTVDFEMSRWNDRMSDLYKRARIQTDDKAKSIADRQLYDMMLQDTRHYKEIAEELSLRDLNRFQFRRNRSANGVPVQKAGSGK